MDTLHDTAAAVQGILLPPELVDLAELLEGDGGPGPDPEAAAWWWEQARDTATAVPPGAPLLPLAELLDVQASYYRSLGTVFGDWVARGFDGMAARAREHGASTTEEFDRCELAAADDRHAQTFAKGYDAAVQGHGL